MKEIRVRPAARDRVACADRVAWVRGSSIEDGRDPSIGFDTEASERHDTDVADAGPDPMPPPRWTMLRNGGPRSA